MAVFNQPWNDHPLDWQILQNSPIALYFRREAVQHDITWFRGQGYDVFHFDCSLWTSEQAFHENVATDLRFPDYYGQNLDAFNDCLGDLEIKDDGGVLIVLEQYDQFVRLNQKTAWSILDAIAQQSRIHALLGRRLVTFVQSDDAALELDPVGACAVMWNPKESPKSSRER